MKPEKIAEFEKQLLEIRERLRAEVSSRIDRVPEQVKAQGELSDAPNHVADRDVEGIDVEEEAGSVQFQELQATKDALDRIDSGTFGKCVACGASIAEERLEAMPFAPRCLECEQETATQA